ISGSLTGEAGVRASNYREMIKAHYELITPAYRQAWGDSFHFAVFSPGESLAEAVMATERWVGNETGCREGDTVLDIGCGLGGPALTIAEHTGANIVGVDLVEQHVEIARERAAERHLSGPTRFLCADGMDLPFADESFDHAYTFEAGCHMPDKAAFCREVARV